MTVRAVSYPDKSGYPVMNITNGMRHEIA